VQHPSTWTACPELTSVLRRIQDPHAYPTLHGNDVKNIWDSSSDVMPMAADSIIYCLEHITDYDQFERVCHDLMVAEG
jgi:hypothetical protein